MDENSVTFHKDGGYTYGRSINEMNVRKPPASAAAAGAGETSATVAPKAKNMPSIATAPRGKFNLDALRSRSGARPQAVTANATPETPAEPAKAPATVEKPATAAATQKSAPEPKAETVKEPEKKAEPVKVPVPEPTPEPAPVEPVAPVAGEAAAEETPAPQFGLNRMDPLKEREQNGGISEPAPVVEQSTSLADLGLAPETQTAQPAKEPEPTKPKKAKSPKDMKRDAAMPSSSNAAPTAEPASEPEAEVKELKLSNTTPVVEKAPAPEKKSTDGEHFDPNDQVSIEEGFKTLDLNDDSDFDGAASMDETSSEEAPKSFIIHRFRAFTNMAGTSIAVVSQFVQRACKSMLPNGSFVFACEKCEKIRVYGSFCTNTDHNDDAEIFCIGVREHITAVLLVRRTQRTYDISNSISVVDDQACLDGVPFADVASINRTPFFI